MSDTNQKEIIACAYCWKHLDDSETENPRTDGDGDVMCDICYSDIFQEYCPICEEYFDRPVNPTDAYFVISKEGEGEAGLNAGLYHFLHFFGDIIGDISMQGDNIELVKECNVNSMICRLYGKRKEKINGSEFVCKRCAERYGRNTHFFSERTLWTPNRLHRNIFIRGIMQSGK